MFTLNTMLSFTMEEPNALERIRTDGPVFRPLNNDDSLVLRSHNLASVQTSFLETFDQTLHQIHSLVKNRYEGRAAEPFPRHLAGFDFVPPWLAATLRRDDPHGQQTLESVCPSLDSE